MKKRVKDVKEWTRIEPRLGNPLPDDLPERLIKLCINSLVVTYMDKDLQELDRMMDELKEINQELDQMHKQMTESLLERVALLEKLT